MSGPQRRARWIRTRPTGEAGGDDVEYEYDYGYGGGSSRFTTGAGEGPPRIVVRVPGVEDLHTVADLLRRAGFEATGARRTFAVEGSLTVAQAAALMELAVFHDSNSDGNQLEIRFESIPPAPGPDPLDWWGQQQAVRR